MIEEQQKMEDWVNEYLAQLLYLKEVSKNDEKIKLECDPEDKLKDWKSRYGRDCLMIKS